MALTIQAVVSYRSIPRILSLMPGYGLGPGGGWLPHFTSVIHWSLRLGLGLLERVKPIDVPWLAMIDHSIDVGTKKALVVLRVRLDTLAQREEAAALPLSDGECIGLPLRTSAIKWPVPSKSTTRTPTLTPSLSPGPRRWRKNSGRRHGRF